MKTKLDRIKAMIDREKTRDDKKHQQMVKRAKISDIRREDDTEADFTMMKKTMPDGHSKWVKKPKKTITIE